MDYCDVACSSIGKIERIEKGGQDCLEDQRFRPREEFKVASEETWARYARVKTYVFPSRLFFNEFSIFYVHKLSLWRNATNVKRD